MVSQQQVLYVNYLKETYGDQLEGAMMAGLMQNSPYEQQDASKVAMTSAINGLVMERDSKFYAEYAKAGGDVDYLKYALQCFNNIRNQMVKFQ